MNHKKIIDRFKKEYPGKNIVLNDKKNPTEIICEKDPASDHSAYATAIVAIEKTTPHFHKRTAEIYYVLEGELELVIGGEKKRLKAEEFAVVPPETVHSATGNEALVLVYSEPGWTVEDHLVEVVKSDIPRVEMNNVRLLVTDFAASFIFYKEVMGFDTLTGDEAANYAEFDTGFAKLALFKLELMEKTLNKKGLFGKTGSMLLVLKSENVDKSFALLKERGAKLLDEVVDQKDWGIRAFHLQDPEGNVVEIYTDLK